ncbi:MAG: penicillin acylase family protein [Chloroflexota bacterium]|nr:MAG: penicillin acylase family protein [Chloroflexota bacterium]
MKKSRSKKIIQIVVPIVVVVLILPIALGYVWFYNTTRAPLPQHNGELRVAGLKDSVEIFRDELGVPHIYASNTHDLFFAQGYTQAQDRWWQMEFWRHVGSGKIEELVGKNDALLSTDIFIRTLGWRRIAEKDVKECDDESLARLQAFTDGVNAYITSRDPDKLALEYSILKLTGIDTKIEPWTPVDTFVFSKMMAWDLGPSNNDEENRATLYELIGQEMTDQLLTPPWPFDKRPTIVQPEDLPIACSTDDGKANHMAESTDMDILLAESPLPSMNLVFEKGRGIGSNNWVVSGNMTKSGMPLLANDPHLGIQMPSIWYEIGLHYRPTSGESPSDIVGYTFAVTPGIIIGHNNFIAWGVTNVNPDVFDLYYIRVNPNNQLQYEWNGEWRDMTVHKETINFGDGADPITIQVRETHLGPIINDTKIDKETGEVSGFNNESPLALRWTALDPSTLIQSVTQLNNATNWTEFRNALSHWDVPSQNFVYADIEGNIGYQTPGHIPIRAKNHSGLVPAPGWTDEFEWKGFIPFDALPRIFNPERGYIATANQAVVPMEYYDWLANELGDGLNYIISKEWNYGYRGQRIVELLKEMAPHTISSFQAIQGDNKLICAEEIMPYLADLKFDDAKLAEARDWLLEWDYQCNMNSPQAALYAEFWLSLINNLFCDQLNANIEVRGGDRDMWAVFLLMDTPDNAWWDDVRSNSVIETRDDILTRSFRDAYSKTISALGKNHNKWRWGDLHTATFVSNPLGQSGIGLIENLVNRGPFPTSGSTDTVNNTVWYTSSRDFSVKWVPSMRMIVDLDDFSNSITIHTTGQSGHPYSKHYDDMIDLWREIKYQPMLWTREQVENAAVDHLILNPGK